MKLTQDALAERAGVAQSTIVRIESGEQFPSMRIMRDICRALRVKRYQDLFPYPDLNVERIG